MYKYDTHVHTDETSSCGQVKAKDVVRLYKEAGYDGIIITDHYYEGFFRSLETSSWEEKVNRYLKGYKIAVEEGIKLGITVLLGIEMRFTENDNDYLVYGMTEDFLKANPELYKLGLKAFRKLIHDEDILIFQAHPFRIGMVLADPWDIDGVEVFNGNPRHDSKNDRALAFAKENRLLMSSGSDFHQTVDLARGGIIISEKITSSREFVKVLRNKANIELIRSEIENY